MASENDEKNPGQILEHVIEQRKASMRYFNENYYTEWAEIYRNLNARTKPHQIWNGQDMRWGRGQERSHERLRAGSLRHAAPRCRQVDAEPSESSGTRWSRYAGRPVQPG